MKIVLRAANILTCLAKSPSAPLPPPPAPEAQDASVVAKRDDERRRQRAATSNTFLTSYSGTSSPAPVGMKTLLGS